MKRIDLFLSSQMHWLMPINVADTHPYIILANQVCKLLKKKKKVKGKGKINK